MNREIMINKPLLNIENNVKETPYQGSLMGEANETNPVFEKLAEENHENFYNYLEWLGLVSDPNFIILPSIHHYYYDREDLEGIKTVINLKHLNHTKQIKDFLHTIYHILPKESYFIGSFIDNKNQMGYLSGSYKSKDQIDQVENGVASKIPFINTIFNLIDSKTDKFLTKRTVRLMLEDSGLKVLDMTELNGLTYFCTQNMKASA